MWAALGDRPDGAEFYGPVGRSPKRSLHTMLLEYISFIILLFALFTIAGGILSGNMHGTPLVNAGLLVIGAVLASSVVGTTGASMIMIRPIIRANDNRRVQRACRRLLHLPGVEHRRLADAAGRSAAVRRLPARRRFLLDDAAPVAETLFVGALLLAIFFALDVDSAPQGRGSAPEDQGPHAGFPHQASGLVNIPLLAGVIAAILMSASWKPGVAFTVIGVRGGTQNLLRDVIMLVARDRLADAHAQARYRDGQRLFLGADQGSRKALRRHFHLRSSR
jgi:Na+/H+ antiporter NhaD/arsenite permease-like protein